MKIKLLTICFLLFTSQVFADDFDKYEREISSIKMTCNDPTSIYKKTFSTDGNYLYFSTCTGCPKQELHVGTRGAFGLSGRIQDFRKKDGENTFLLECWREGLGGSNITFDVYVNFQKRKVIKHGVEWDCFEEQ